LKGAPRVHLFPQTRGICSLFGGERQEHLCKHCTDVFTASNAFPHFNCELMLKDEQPMIHDWLHKRNAMTRTTQALRDKKGQAEQQTSVDGPVRVDLAVSSFFEISHKSKTNLPVQQSIIV
jgi:hypothetical protein